ncbi:hypothetical protein [Saccharothrix sp. NRRL B-16348]|uniref:hypothetical protein n=1 Tax=Saccharothrix sp. NRRL B-16348 TaxID=1415542 RepID=UPI000A87EE0C|nr:hypothetical protein [Saccharothrix sp. NRRL B-16348]
MTPPTFDSDDVVIRALSLPAVLPGRTRARSRKLDVGDLYARVNNTTLHFALSSVDHRGRLTSRQTFSHLQWPPGKTLTSTFGRNYVLLRPAADGELTVGERGRLLLPSNLLHYCGIGAHRQILLIAAADHDMLVVHPQQNIAEMVRGFHEAQFQRNVHRRVSGDHR